MKLLPAIEGYVTLKRALGAVFTVDARILRSFGRSQGDVAVDTLTSEGCRAFCRGDGLPTRFWERKHQSLRSFFDYLVTRGHIDRSPLPGPLPRIERTFHPYIYSHAEIQRLLEAASQPVSRGTLVEPETLRTLILLLYGAGLRAGEALRLRLCDANLRDRVLSIWSTKFFKSRLIPIGVSLTEALARYAQTRKHPHPKDGSLPRFFTTRTGKPVPLGRLERRFVHLREQTEIRRPQTDRWQPRLHDLRATFAVHRLVAWYREGVDLQIRLPLLATYLGHINISGTQAYLTMTHELLTEASRRFEDYARPTKENSDA
jgi:integrase/recombinase XerD